MTPWKAQGKLRYRVKAFIWMPNLLAQTSFLNHVIAQIPLIPAWAQGLIPTWCRAGSLRSTPLGFSPGSGVLADLGAVQPKGKKLTHCCSFFSVASTLKKTRCRHCLGVIPGSAETSSAHSRALPSPSGAWTSAQTRGWVHTDTPQATNTWKKWAKQIATALGDSLQEHIVKWGGKPLTVQDCNEGHGHDQDTHQHVCHRQGHQKEVCGILQLLLQGHSHNYQYVSPNGQQDDNQDQEGRPILLPHGHPRDFALLRGIQRIRCRQTLIQSQIAA